MTTARTVAVEVLLTARTANAWASELVDEQFARTSLSPADRRFVTQLVFGVVRRRATLDALIRPFIQRPFHSVEPAVVDVLRLGAYQLAILTQIPKHAAVNETVDLARVVGSPMAKGFINGVLRRVSELVTDEFTDRPAKTALPLDDDRFRVLSQPILPDPDTDTVNYLAAGFSWPRWLAERWFSRFGRDESLRLGFWFNAAPPTWLRVNSLQTDREAFRISLTAKGIDTETGEHPQSVRLVDSTPIREIPGYSEGDFTVQDHSAMTVASALHPQPGWRVLDVCSAPGGKTTHLAEMMKNRGTIVACDIDADRLRTVTTLCQRLGIRIVEPVILDKADTVPPAGPFDAALVDVPCSNTGVLGRRPEVRWRLDPTEFEELIRLQTRLLFTAIERVRPGGVVVYSTCSIEPEENGGVVAAAKRAFRGLRIEAESTAIPGRPADGGYWARIKLPM